MQPQASERVRAKAMMETVRDDARVYDADGGISGGERSARSDPFANLGMTSARRDASSLALHQTSAEISHIPQQHHRSLLVCRCIRRNAWHAVLRASQRSHAASDAYCDPSIDLPSLPLSMKEYYVLISVCASVALISVSTRSCSAPVMYCAPSRRYRRMRPISLAGFGHEILSAACSCFSVA